METYNQKLKYKGNLEKDEVWIDIDRTGEDRIRDFIVKYFTKYKIERNNVCKILFFIYKKKSSWISYRDKKINFIYDIKMSSVTNTYILYFNKLNGQGLTDTIDIGNNNCFPKKVLIKYLLNELLI